MIRADLLALTPEALARLANVGLVKRAQKEIEAGVLPMLAEEADGTVVASARDGASTRLPRGVALQNAPCTCGASQVCRHRIAAVLAYQKANPAPAATHDPSWDPGSLGDAALLQCCGPGLVKRAETMIARGIVVTTRGGSRTAQGQVIAPSAMLPTATVQFLVPDDVAYAKCDCSKGQGCEHIIVAVRAFRAGPAGGVYTLHTGAATATASGSSPGAVILEALDHVAQYGLVAPGSQAKLEHARGAAERDAWWWIVDGIESLERLADAYQRQSTRFRIEALAREVGELTARLRASASAVSPLPAAWLLGSDQVGETAMEQVRLLALGVRLDADGERRMARLYFADPDTATVLVLDKIWPAEARFGAELGQLFASSRMSVADLARGELVTRAARRRANGSLDLGAARGMKSSLLPSSGNWMQLPEPLLVRDLEAHAARRRALPPPCLCPRGLGASIAVVEIARVIDVDDVGEGQSVTGLVEDAAGNRLVLHTEHRQVSPGAVEATAAALRSTPRYVAGELVRTADGWRMDPLALLTTQLVVVDLHRPRGAAKIVRPESEAVVAAAPDAADQLAAATQDYVGRTLLKGLRTTAPIAARLAKEAERLFAYKLAALFTRAANGATAAVLDLTVLHQIEIEFYAHVTRSG